MLARPRFSLRFALFLICNIASCLAICLQYDDSLVVKIAIAVSLSCSALIWLAAARYSVQPQKELLSAAIACVVSFTLSIFVFCISFIASDIYSDIYPRFERVKLTGRLAVDLGARATLPRTLAQGKIRSLSFLEDSNGDSVTRWLCIEIDPTTAAKWIEWELGAEGPIQRHVRELPGKRKALVKRLAGGGWSSLDGDQFDGTAPTWWATAVSSTHSLEATSFKDGEVHSVHEVHIAYDEKTERLWIFRFSRKK